MKIGSEIAGITLEHPIMNAAGTCKTLDDVKKLARSASAAITLGSMTMEPRTGNTGETYFAGPMHSLNSLGLPNPGSAHYKRMLPEMAKVARDAGKPLMVSVAGFSPEEYALLATFAMEGGADLVELNLGCPNVWQGGAQKRIACFDALLVAQILRRVEDRVGRGAKVSVKVSPFSDPFTLIATAQVVGSFNVVKAVATTNTFPNAFCYKDGKPAITPAEGLAGFAGPALKPIGLGQVRQWRSNLPERIQMVGVGGVTHGRDIWEYRDSGTAAVQVATAYLEHGERVFSSLLEELIGFMSE